MKKKMNRVVKILASDVRDDIKKKDWLTKYEDRSEANAQ